MNLKKELVILHDFVFIYMGLTLIEEICDTPAE
jgi:hypothetical protein